MRDQPAKPVNVLTLPAPPMGSHRRAARAADFAAKAPLRQEARRRNAGRTKAHLIALAVSQAVALPVIVISATDPAFYLFLREHAFAVESVCGALVILLTMGFFALLGPWRGPGAT